MRGRFHVPMLVSAGLLLVLIGLLGTLQYRWLGQISDAERQRMTSTLNARASAFATDVDRELTRAYLLFQVDQPPDGADVAARLGASYDRWQATARFPRLIKEIDLVLADEEGKLERFDPSRRLVEPIDWPGSLAPIRRDLLPQRVSPSPQQTMVTRVIPAPLVASVPALIVPTPVLVMNEHARRAELGALPSLSYTILILDADYMQHDMLPSLAQQHFRGTGDGIDYQLAVVDARSNGFVYRSSPAFTPRSDAPADAVVGLFQVRTQDFGTLAAEVRRFTTFVTVRQDSVQREQDRGMSDGSPGRVATRQDHPASMVFEQRVAGPTETGGVRVGTAPFAAARIGLTPSPEWRLLVKHPSGSLERAISAARRRNLIVSSSVLAILCVSVGFLVVSTRRAQELARRQMEFVAGVSHELRTPLAVIRSAADNLADGVICEPAQVQKYGELVRGEGRRLTEMVEQILEYAGIQSGQRGFALRPVSIRTLIDDVLDASRTLIDAAHVRVEVEVPETLPPVLGDERGLARVLQNLIGNAVKYGASGGWLGITAEASGEEVTIAIADKGIGIDPADHARIFEPFYRAPDAVAAQIQGAGLGLSLVQHIVESHGGRMTVLSARASGSTFTVHLPLESLELADRAGAEPRSAASPAAHHP
jgi:signal transduction histidine kinase